MFKKVKKTMALKREVKAILAFRRYSYLASSIEYGPWEVSAKELKDELLKQGYKCATYGNRVILYSYVF